MRSLKFIVLLLLLTGAAGADELRALPQLYTGATMAFPFQVGVELDPASTPDDPLWLPAGTENLFSVSEASGTQVIAAVAVWPEGAEPGSPPLVTFWRSIPALGVYTKPVARLVTEDLVLRDDRPLVDWDRRGWHALLSVSPEDPTIGVMAGHIVIQAVDDYEGAPTGSGISVDRIALQGAIDRDGKAQSWPVPRLIPGPVEWRVRFLGGGVFLGSELTVFGPGRQDVEVTARAEVDGTGDGIADEIFFQAVGSTTATFEVAPVARIAIDDLQPTSSVGTLFVRTQAPQGIQLFIVSEAGDFSATLDARPHRLPQAEMIRPDEENR